MASQLSDTRASMLSDLISVIMSTVDPLQERTQRALRHLTQSTVPYEIILLSRNYQWKSGPVANQGISAAVGGYVAFCCDDCFVDPDALEHLKRALKDQSVGVAGALLRYPDEQTVQHAGAVVRVVPVMGVLGRQVSIGAAHIAHHEPLREFISQDVDCVTGALMMTRRDVLDRIGWYDSDCELAWGDVDFCLRAWQGGFRVRFVAEAKAIHIESATRGKRMGSGEWFLKKWSEHLQKSSLARPAAVAGG